MKEFDFAGGAGRPAAWRRRAQDPKVLLHESQAAAAELSAQLQLQQGLVAGLERRMAEALSGQLHQTVLMWLLWMGALLASDSWRAAAAALE